MPKSEKVVEPALKKFKVVISDTVTYERRFTAEIEAEDEEDACDKGRENAEEYLLAAIEAQIDIDEKQIDNTPWEAELATDEG